MCIHMPKYTVTIFKFNLVSQREKHLVDMTTITQLQTMMKFNSKIIEIYFLYLEIHCMFLPQCAICIFASEPTRHNGRYSLRYFLRSLNIICRLSLMYSFVIIKTSRHLEKCHVNLIIPPQ